MQKGLVKTLFSKLVAANHKYIMWKKKKSPKTPEQIISVVNRILFCLEFMKEISPVTRNLIVYYR